MVSYFFILNSSGCMTYSYTNIKEDPSTNRLLILSSSLHSIKYMISEINNKDCFENYIFFQNNVVSIYTTLTNTTFIFIGKNKAKKIFENVYKEYCDYVLKNPFHILDMPIQCDKFNPSKYFTTQM